ncbi:Alpha amylase domain protein [hydrothermal vent metagenome]|uniref:Alpha amylase domain protein n=1 Tax=hydrothermal vent metagenome TaxID=652676 RepID=A0A3B0QVN4_9ZZZZ
MSKLYLYTVFHKNLAFSLIPEEDYPHIIESCYWPLLQLAADGVPVGIEATAYTLKVINDLDPSYIRRLRDLWEQGLLEFIGSGYGQIIMPLVPADVNRWNLELGNKYYRELLGRAPRTALVNEQTFSKGMVDLYRKAGFDTLIMDWDNCYQHNRYPKEYLYYPQKAVGHDTDINLVWNHSIAFQKFQRYIHGELGEQAYREFIDSHFAEQGDRAFMLYGNDAEVFDYRPGSGEKVEDTEFARLTALLRSLSEKKNIVITTPGSVVAHFESTEKSNGLAFNRISLESSASPIPCKKQSKYNPVRWAATGRDSVHINTYCHKVLENIRWLEKKKGATVVVLSGLKEMLCELWGSDYRTNTIDEKQLNFQNRMGWLRCETERMIAGYEEAQGCIGPECGDQCRCRAASLTTNKEADGFKDAVVEDSGDILKVKTDFVEAEFLKKKGFALSSLVFPEVSDDALLGTLEHGYYEDIAHGADFFSGHLINVARDGTKVTDLSFVEPVIEESAQEVSITLNIALDIGILRKRYLLSKKKSEISVSYRLKVQALGASSLRLGIFTFMPQAFDRGSLYFETVNGGLLPDRFALEGVQLMQDSPVSQRVSASGCLGATEGWVAIGDRDKEVRITTDKSELYSVPLINYTEIDDKFFLRLYHSIGELDDTAWWIWRGYNSISFKVTAHRRGE